MASAERRQDILLKSLEIATDLEILEARLKETNTPAYKIVHKVNEYLQTAIHVMGKANTWDLQCEHCGKTEENNSMSKMGIDQNGKITCQDCLAKGMAKLKEVE